ncbi:ribonuclease E activity regulator RraA [Thiomicrorhabdus indica]|uniref:ribonuclease E activity regulator RraA n=1 Tax=Thiomicrorhabdus indica TaxID=2267253 RepID=UPI002AA8F2FC|nr:ribonuclease E activity regulator RraA [Thiomicrorhabdus indica]
MKFETPELCDQYKNQIKVLPPIFKSFGGKTKLSGQIATLKIEHNNTLFWDVLREDGQGKVLVVDAGAEVFAVMGDQMGLLAVENNWSGVIINGYIRDSATLQTLPIGVWALGAYPMKGFKTIDGSRDLELDIHGLTIKPSDTVYADEDGLVFLDQKLSTKTQLGF